MSTVSIGGFNTVDVCFKMFTSVSFYTIKIPNTFIYPKSITFYIIAIMKEEETDCVAY